MTSQLTLEPIGIIHSPFTELQECPSSRRVLPGYAARHRSDDRFR